MFVNFIWRIYVARMLCFEIIIFEEFILLGDVSLMTCCYTLRKIYVIRSYCFFYEVSSNFCMYIKDKQDSKIGILKVSFICGVLVPYM